MKEVEWLEHSYREISKWRPTNSSYPQMKTFQNKLVGTFPSLEFTICEDGFKCRLPFKLNLYDASTTKFEKTIPIYAALPGGILKDLLTKEPTVEVLSDKLIFRDLILTVDLQFYLGGKERYVFNLENHTFKMKETKNYTLETAKCRK